MAKKTSSLSPTALGRECGVPRKTAARWIRGNEGLGIEPIASASAFRRKAAQWKQAHRRGTVHFEDSRGLWGARQLLGQGPHVVMDALPVPAELAGFKPISMGVIDRAIKAGRLTAERVPCWVGHSEKKHVAELQFILYRRKVDHDCQGKELRDLLTLRRPIRMRDLEELKAASDDDFAWEEECKALAAAWEKDFADNGIGIRLGFDEITLVKYSDPKDADGNRDRRGRKPKILIDHPILGRLIDSERDQRPWNGQGSGQIGNKWKIGDLREIREKIKELIGDKVPIQKAMKETGLDRKAILDLVRDGKVEGYQLPPLAAWFVDLKALPKHRRNNSRNRR